MRLLFALPGLHRVDRGAEVAFLAIGRELAKRGHQVTLAGSGPERSGAPYRFMQVPSVTRQKFERMPLVPLLRDVTSYEELTFMPGLLMKYRPANYDLTVTCSYPYTNWMLRRPVLGGRRPPHVFVTENGDWPARATSAEYRFFGCEGLVCINPDFYAANKDRWFSSLIPNGVDAARFDLPPTPRSVFGLPADKKIVLMVSAFIASKRVDAAIRAAAGASDIHLVVAGDGPERAAIHALAEQLIPGRFTNLTLPAARMPELYNAADLFLHMSMDESFGNVYLEAMASGLPVIGHDSPRLRWIVGDVGHLIDTRDLAAVTRSLVDTVLPDAEGRRRIKHGADQFGWARIGEQYEAFFNQVIARSGGARTA